MGDALSREAKLAGSETASEVEARQFRRSSAGGRLTIGRGTVGGGLRRVRLLLIEDGGDVGDRARRRDEVLALERGRYLLRLVDRHGRLRLDAGKVKRRTESVSD